MPKMPAPVPPPFVPDFVSLEEFKTYVKETGCEVYENISLDTLDLLLRAHQNRGFFLYYLNNDNYSDYLRKFYSATNIEFIAFIKSDDDDLKE